MSVSTADGRDSIASVCEADIRLAIAGWEQPVVTRKAAAVEIEVELLFRPVDVGEAAAAPMALIGSGFRSLRWLAGLEMKIDVAMLTHRQIRGAMAMLGLTQEKRGKMAGLSKTAITNIESRETDPKRSTLLAIQTALEKAGPLVTFRGHRERARGARSGPAISIVPFTGGPRVEPLIRFSWASLARK